MKPVKKIPLLLMFGLMSVFIKTDSLAGDKNQWGYTGHSGPRHWGGLAEEYFLCKAGREQSPININRSILYSSESIQFWYSSRPDNIVNNGHTIQVNMKEGSRITVAGKTYRLLQFHFHSPSEHQINGKPAAMVIHFVHQAEDGQLGVVGLLFDEGPANKTIRQLWKYLPRHPQDEAPLPATIDIKALLPNNRAYYNYTGSLTTPPCSEGVNWMILKGRASVARQQIKQFTRLFPRSVRPVQPINHRIVYAR